MNDFNEQLANFDQLLDAFKQMSEQLNGVVKTLMAEGWTESQARDLVVATFVQNAKTAT